MCTGTRIWFVFVRRLQAIIKTLRHSRAGGNPAKTKTPRSGQNMDFDLLRRLF